RHGNENVFLRKGCRVECGRWQPGVMRRGRGASRAILQSTVDDFAWRHPLRLRAGNALYSVDEALMMKDRRWHHGTASPCSSLTWSAAPHFSDSCLSHSASATTP